MWLIMLFPLMISIALGVALESHYLAEKKDECKGWG